MLSFFLLFFSRKKYIFNFIEQLVCLIKVLISGSLYSDIVQKNMYKQLFSGAYKLSDLDIDSLFKSFLCLPSKYEDYRKKSVD